MNKSINVGIYGLVLIFLYLGSALMFESCGGKKEKTDEINDLNAQLEGVADENTSEAFFEEGTDSGFESEVNTNNGEIDYSASNSTSTGEVDYTAPPTKSVTSPSTTRPSSTSNSSASYQKSSVSGTYMVIAGNYLVESNADVMVKKLRASGYSGAESVVFDLSQYYTVLAGRYEARSSANSASEDLKRKGFDNYVLKGKD
jgi:cell division septation protein DedD